MATVRAYTGFCDTVLRRIIEGATSCNVRAGVSLFVFVEVEYRYGYVSHVDCRIIIDVCVGFPVG